MRNNTNGILLKDLLIYNYKYAHINTTKQSIVNNINFKNGKTHDRTNYIRKERNIPLQIYELIAKEITNLCNNYYKNLKNDEPKYIAIDGTSTNDKHNNIVLNMGYYDINNRLILDLDYKGKENRNKEVKCTIKYIQDNLNLFKNTTIVGDRAYFSYNFINFLTNNNINFIIRCKNNYKNIYLKTKNTKVIKYEDTFDKIIWTRHTKQQKSKKKILEVINT